ncbi:MAG: response regulator transcription factor [Phycisphaerales bacterium]|nr:response regulator transcription factor [Phycisphaerales bacterium]
MSERTMVLLVDDHTLVREVCARLIEGEPDLRVIAQAADAEAGVEAAEQHRPDVVLLDIDMPGGSAFDAAQRIVELSPETRVIFLSAYAYDRYIDEAIGADAAGFITKDVSPERVLDAVRQVAAGGMAYSPKVMDRLMDRSGEGPGGATRANTLTRREREVLTMIGEGCAKKVISERLGVSIKTVEKHAANVMRKLGLNDRVAICRYCVREGLIAP